jgi:MFS family permease
VSYRWTIVGIGFLNIAASIGLARFAYTLIMPDMRQGLGLSYGHMGMIAGAGFAVYALSCPVAGLATVRLGMRWVIAGSLALAGLGLSGLGRVGGFATGLLANLAVQAGSAGATTAGFVVTAAWFPPSSRGRAAGWVLGGAGAGIALGGRLVPTLLASRVEGWRAAWTATGLATLLVAVACALLLRDPPGPGLETLPRPGKAAADIIRHRGLWGVAALTGLFGFEYIIFGTFFAVRLRETGWSVDAVGDLWFLVGLLTIASGPIGGVLADRLGRWRTMGLLAALQAIASGALAVSATPPFAIGASVLYGATVMGFPAAVAALCADLVGPARAAAAMGFTNIAFATGQALGPLVAGLIIEASGSVAPALALGGALSLAGSLGAVRLARLLDGRPPPRRRRAVEGSGEPGG